MKKILLIGPFPIGNKGLNGQTIANQTLYEGLKNKYDVKFINTLKELEFTDKKEQGKFKLGKFLKISLSFIKETFHMLFSRYDVIYITPGQSFLGFTRFSPYMFLGFIKHIPCYIHIHGGNFRNVYNNLSKKKQNLLNYFFKRLSGAIVLGSSLKTMFKDLMTEDKIFVCENGVQDEIIATKKEIQQKMEKFKRNKKRKVLYLSNLMKEKGILEVLKASEKFNDDEIEFNLAGAIEPEIKDTVEKYLKKYPNKIIYHGIVSGQKKKELLLNNDIFILPTYYSNEGQPISILEAYTTGCSVITTNQGGICDVFKDKVNGYLCTANNVDSICRSIELIRDDQEIMINNYEYGIENFKKDKFIEKIEKVILGIKNENKKI